VAPDDEKPDFGEQRTTKPGQMFRYASGCRLTTPTGMLAAE